jgi:predicted house-cleaning NTP pyrophosphatase (Maf/HAM1 superfamily)
LPWQGRQVSELHPEALVIGADQTLDLDGRG